MRGGRGGVRGGRGGVRGVGEGGAAGRLAATRSFSALESSSRLRSQGTTPRATKAIRKNN